ncbi:MAG: RNA polymerase sigma factor (sigma-70 family) [Planctomycetota bacterium]|jgi:RNA polymerase sigma factor (sigma-70 family)
MDLSTGNQRQGAAQGDPEMEAAREAEAQLVRRAPRDPEAFAALYRRHYPAIQRYLRRRLGDPDLVEDAVAETFVSALQQISRYEERGLPFRSWLYMLATGQASRQRRRAARLAQAQLEIDPVSVDPISSPSVDVVRAALLRISERHQAVIALHHLEGLSLEVVAHTLGCRVGTVKSRLARGRDALRAQLERMGERS